MNMKVRWIVFVILSATDRAAKCWAKANLPETLGNAVIPSLSLYRNEGISFSLMKNSPHASLAATILGMGILAFLCARIAPARKSFGVIFLWAGAAGNLADRLLYGHVIDWIYVGEYINLADIWLVIGGLVFFAEIVRAGKPL
ncbi:MAG: signal peptidase II [Synergistaceae bacterium]|jgi:signal peptidase II|nr:signal peptidase II [Synergistaceae bacterium]